MGAQLSGTDRSPSPGRPIGSNSSRITSGSADSCITDACARMLVRMRHSRLGPEGMFVCMRHSRLGRAGGRSRPAPPAPLPRTIRTAGGTRCRGPRHRARSCAHCRTWLGTAIPGRHGTLLLLPRPSTVDSGCGIECSTKEGERRRTAAACAPRSEGSASAGDRRSWPARQAERASAVGSRNARSSGCCPVTRCM